MDDAKVIHRLSRPDGSVIGEFPTADAARKIARQLERAGTSYRWESWGGARTGWNSVLSFVGPNAEAAALS
jgi:hypothetical protein